MPVAVDFQELLPGDCPMFRGPIGFGRGKDPGAMELELEMGGTADAADGEDALAAVCHC